MGLFSRKKKNDRKHSDDRRRDEPAADTSSSEEAGMDGATDAAERRGARAAEGGGSPAGSDADGTGRPEPGSDGAGPQVNISMSSFQGLGSAGGAVDPATVDSGEEKTQQVRRPAPQPQAPARPPLPGAPAAPPAQWETVKGLRDNALVRDALAALPEKATGAQVMGVIRQMLQGHLYLRVQGDAKEKLAAGGQVTFGIARSGDKEYMMAFSSGAALRDAVKADGDTQTSAVGQPVQALMKHLLAGTFAGLILDNHSARRRAVLPREVLEKAFGQADPQLRIKTLLTQPREAETPHKLASLLAERPPLWVAVGEVAGDATAEQKKFGIAEARLADGTRLLQVFSHPLEVVALGRQEKAMPLAVDKIAKMLRDHPQLGGVIVDPAGPLMTLTRDELAPVIALAG